MKREDLIEAASQFMQDVTLEFDDRDAANLVDTLLQALREPTEEWQPFRSAPHDGSHILVYRPDAGVFTAHYVEEDAHLSSVMHPPEGDFYWFSISGEDLTNDLPTHWRPLPAPPPQGGENG